MIIFFLSFFAISALLNTLAFSFNLSTLFLSEEYMRTFIIDNYVQKLKQCALKGGLRSSRFRSIAWLVFLNCLSEHRTDWLSSAHQLRNDYEALREKYNTNPYLPSDSDFSQNNPLSQEESVCNFFFIFIYFSKLLINSSFTELMESVFSRQRAKDCHQSRCSENISWNWSFQRRLYANSVM